MAGPPTPSDSSAPADPGAESAVDSADPGETSDSVDTTPLSADVAIGTNPDNPFSALVSVTPSAPSTVRLRYGEGAPDHTTPWFDVDGTALLPLLGLHADRTYTAVVDVATDTEAWTSEPLPYTTEPVPPNFPVCTATFTAPEAEFGADEAICSNFQGSDGRHSYDCFDRWGQPIFSARTPTDDSLRSMARLADGSWAGTGFTAPKTVFLNQASQDYFEVQASYFEGRTRFPLDFIDSHELLEIPSGPWAGAVVFATNVSEDLEDGTYVVGNGFIVYDRRTDTVLYDYSFVGDTSDGVSNDPKVAYSRGGTGDYAGDWTHLNSMLYGEDPDGRAFFLIALKAQDWIVKLYPDTDEIAWTVGFEGDFALVDDIDAASPSGLSDPDWMFHAHGMSWVAHDGPRMRLLLFDNGYPRHDGDAVLWDHPYSRVVELDLDEDTRLASTPFVYAPDDLFSSTGGNARLQPAGDSVLFLLSEANQAREVTYPDGAERWRLVCEYHGEWMYRVTWFAAL